jgi:Flp pilus assembly protein TadD
MSKFAPGDRPVVRVILTLAAIALTAPVRGWPAVKPLDKRQVIGLVEGGVASPRIARLVSERGLSFDVTPDFLRFVENKGARNSLLDALRNAKQPAPPPAAEAPVAENPQAVAYAQNYQQAKSSLQEGKRDVFQKRWPEAEAEMRKVVQIDPRNVQARSALAYVLSQEGQWNAAIGEYRRALDLDPDQAPVHYNLGVALDKEHRPDKAIVEYRQAVKLDANNEKAVYALGVDLYGEGEWLAAAAEFTSALRLAPADSDAHCGLGLAELHQQNVDAAIPELQEALRLNPQNAEAHAGLGGALLRQGKHRAALEQFRVASALEPADASYRADFLELARQLHSDPPHPSANP